MTKHVGQCLCGDIRFQVETEETKAGKCYCDICRAWSAGSLVMIHGTMVPQIENKDALGVYSSSAWGERCFCKRCGTHLFWRKPDESWYGVSVDVLENRDSFELGSEIFVDHKPAYYEATQETKHLTAAQFWAMIAAMSAEQKSE